MIAKQLKTPRCEDAGRQRDVVVLAAHDGMLESFPGARAAPVHRWIEDVRDDRHVGVETHADLREEHGWGDGPAARQRDGGKAEHHEVPDEGPVEPPCGWMGESIHRPLAEKGERDDLDGCAILAGVEVMYENEKRNLDEYINEAGKAVRAYIPRNRNFFSETAKGFVGGTAPTVGQTVGIGANGKLAAGGTGVGKCVAIEKAGRYTYYVIQIVKG